MALNWADQTKSGYGSDWTYWGGDSGHDAGWYSLGDVKNWTPSSQWDASKYKTSSGFKYDFGNGQYGIVDPTSGRVNMAHQWRDVGSGNVQDQYYNPFSGQWVKGDTQLTWSPEMSQSYNNWYGQQQAAAASRTSGAGNITQYYNNPDAAYAAGQLAGNQGGTKAGQAAAAATTGYGNAPGTIPGYLESFYETLGGAFGKPGLYEQWAKDAYDQTNPYYQRLQKQTSDSINQQAAARGNYNSGGTMAAQGNALSALNAAQYKDMGDLMQGAQQAELSRLLGGATVAGNAQNATQGRWNSLLNGQSGIDQSFVNAILGAYGAGGSQSGDSAQSALNALINAAGLNAQGGLANSQNGLAAIIALSRFL